MKSKIILVEEFKNNEIAVVAGNTGLLSFINTEGNVLVYENKKYKVSRTEYSFDENAFIVYVNVIS